MKLEHPIPIPLLVRLLRALEREYPNRIFKEGTPNLAEIVNQTSVLVGMYESLLVAETNVGPKPDTQTPERGTPEGKGKNASHLEIRIGIGNEEPPKGDDSGVG